MERRDLLGMMSLAVFADWQAVSAQTPAPSPPVPASVPDRPTSTPASVREPFVGIYKLVIYQPHGDNPMGRIQYDRGGRMWALLNPPARPRLPQSPTLAEYQATMRGFVAYYGSFDVDEAAKRVIHHVQAGTNPAWIGTDFIRWYRFEGNRLTLSLNAQFTSTLVWERLPDQA